MKLPWRRMTSEGVRARVSLVLLTASASCAWMALVFLNVEAGRPEMVAVDVVGIVGAIIGGLVVWTQRRSGS